MPTGRSPDDTWVFEQDQGEAEIADLDPFNPVFEQDVGRLDVAMDDAVLVRRGKPGRDFRANPQHRGQVERAEADASQGPARHVFHHQVRHAGLLVYGVDGDDVDVIDARRRPPSRRKRRWAVWLVATPAEARVP